jgi:predicted PurR-regulated permease PerM
VTLPDVGITAPLTDNSGFRKTPESGKLIELAYLVVVLFAFAWAKDFLLPIVLAVLVALFLTPVVSRLERWGLHPVLAVISVVGVAFAIIGVLCTTVSVETLNLVDQLPKYRENIHAKWAAIQQGPPGPLHLAFRNVNALISDLNKVSAPGGAGAQSEPARVRIVSEADNALALVRNSMTPVVGPVVGFAVVVVLVVFMLLERKRFRDRFIRLIGHSRLATTTLAVDEVGSRLSGFLLGQLEVNSGYALILGIGLFLIGIPNAILWAVLTLVLRFLPYVGLWISAFCPIVISFAISTTWKEPICTLGLYAFLEVFTNNVVEPIVLGGSTGMSPLAVIISALFWTWLWGPIGLLLATPLSACLIVLGRYFPAFHACSVLLGSTPPTPAETTLIRYLSENRLAEAKTLIYGLGGAQLTIEMAEELLVPAIRTVESNLFPGPAANQTKARIYEQMRELIDELKISSRTETTQVNSEPENPAIVIVPYLGECDEVVGSILAGLLESNGVSACLLSSRLLRSEKMERLSQLEAKSILVSTLLSRSAMAVVKVARSIQESVPGAPVSFGLWSLPREGAARWIRKIKESSGGIVYTSLGDAVRGITSIRSTIDQEPQKMIDPN